MLGGGIVNSVSDLLTTILPIPIVMNLPNAPENSALASACCCVLV